MSRRDDRRVIYEGPKSFEDVERSYVQTGVRTPQYGYKQGIQVTTELSFTNRHRQDLDKDGQSAVSDSESTRNLVVEDARGRG